MKKRFISFVSAIAVAFVAFAQVSEEAVQFTAVQDDARLVAGKRYIVVAQDGEDWVALSDQYNGTTPYRLPAAITVGEEGIETLVATAAVESENLAVPYVLVLEGSADAWKLYDEANGKYLHWVSKRSMTLDEEGSTWAISINENGEAVLKLADEDRTVRYGADDDRFACYTTGQAPVYLYRLVVANEAEMEQFEATYANLCMLTETCASMWMIPAVSEKFFEVQMTAEAMVGNLEALSYDELVAYTATMEETIAFAQAMDAKYNEYKDVLFLCYDYQDNSTASEEARAAFDEIVATYQMYQWSVPAASVEEFAALIDVLKEARLAYAFEATPNEGFEFDIVTVSSPWVATIPVDSLKAYLYNTEAKAFLAAGNSWGTQASFTEAGIEWIVSGEDNVYTLDGPVSNGGDSHYFTGTYTDGGATDVVVELVGRNVFTLKVGENYLAFDGTSIVANVAEVNDSCYWQFVTKAERQGKYADATAVAPAYATFEIAGANFGRNDGNNNAWVGGPALGGDNENFCAEKWNAGIVEISQVLTNMPSGVYRMSAQGFYRMGSIPASIEARNNGTEVLNAKFFANGDSVAVMSVLDGANKLEGVGADYTGFGLAPNNMGEASKFFTAGLYDHSILFSLEEGVDTIKLGVTKTGSVSEDWLIFDNFRLEYLGAKNDVDYMGNGVIASIAEGNHFVYYTDAEGSYHFLNAAGANSWVVSDSPVTIEFSAGNTSEGSFAGAASFMASNGFYMSNAANSDGTGAIKTEDITGGNGQQKRTWDCQVFYKNAAGKYAIRLTNSEGTGWGANCFVNIDPATLAVVSGQPDLLDALYLWEIADESDPRFSTEAVKGLIEAAEALTGACNKDDKAALEAAVAAAKAATAAEVQEVKAALEAAIAAVEASIADYAAIVKTAAEAKGLLVKTAQNYDDLVEAVATAEAGYADATATAETLAALVEAKAAYLAANEVEGLVNGTFGDDTAASTEGWTGEMNTGKHNNWTNINDGFAEKWVWDAGLADIDFYQEIVGLPAGTYTFAAYVNACRQNYEDTYEVSGVSLYANNDSVAVHTFNLDRDATNKAIGAEFVMVHTTIAEGETLKVGLSVKSTDANWVVIDNAKLYNFGGETPAEIMDVEVAEVAVRAFYSLNGVALDAPVKGINIVKTTYTNGVVEVKKVFVK